MNTMHPPPLIRSLHVRNYRVLRHLDLRLEQPFHVMVGPNGIGKSTLFDAVSFVFDLIGEGLENAVAKRTSNFQDLIWQRPADQAGFEIGIEFQLPNALPFHYHIAVSDTALGVRLSEERAYFGQLSAEDHNSLSQSRSLFTFQMPGSMSFVFQRFPRHPIEEHSYTTFFLEPYDGLRVLELGHSEEQSSITMVPNVNRLRTSKSNSSHESTTYSMRTATSVITNLGSTTLRTIHLDARKLKRASPPDHKRKPKLAPDGSNLPSVLRDFLDRHPKQFQQWLAHLQTAVPFISDIRTVTREDDRHQYLMADHAHGFEVPSWGLSDGTLCLMALTLLAYIPDSHPSVYLIEEPENAIHPLALETAYQSLSSAYDAQIILASHSPTLLRCVDQSELLCFARDADDGATIISGPDHPRLKHWPEAILNDLVFATHTLS